MTDIEITKLCAEAMGWKHLGAVGVEPPKGKLNTGGLWCKSGGNDWWVDPQGMTICGPCQGIPDPLQDDAQAMALLLKILNSGQRVCIENNAMKGNAYGKQPILFLDGVKPTVWPIEDADSFRRAICECVAKMQLSRNQSSEVVSKA